MTKQELKQLRDDLLRWNGHSPMLTPDQKAVEKILDHLIEISDQHL